jgi:hypothetical protein
VLNACLQTGLPNALDEAIAARAKDHGIGRRSPQARRNPL